MKNGVLSAIILGLLLISFNSCKKIVGRGPIVSDTRPLNGFNAVHLGMDAMVRISQDSFFKVEIMAEQNIQSEIITRVVGGKLTINHRNHSYIRSKGITVNISMPEVTLLELSGSGSIIFQTSLHAPVLTAAVSGSGDILLPSSEIEMLNADISGSGRIMAASGKGNFISTHISGSGEMDLYNFQAENVVAQISGSGNTRLFVTKHLDVDISGSGCVYYRGDATVSSKISGSGKIIKE